MAAASDHPRVPCVRLRPNAQGFALGTVLALGIFVATNWLVIKGGEVVGPNLELLAQFFVGYSVSFWGSIIGAVYLFVTGFIIGHVSARIYNWFSGLQHDDP
jgi:hypothetical protein